MAKLRQKTALLLNFEKIDCDNSLFLRFILMTGN